MGMKVTPCCSRQSLVERFHEALAGLTSPITPATKSLGAQMLAQRNKVHRWVGGNREERILKVTLTKLPLLEKLKIEIKFSYRKTKEVIFLVCLSFQSDICILYTLYFSPIEEGIKLQRMLIWVFFYISETPSDAESTFGRKLLPTIRKASLSLRSCFRMWCKKRKRQNRNCFLTVNLVKSSFHFGV